MKLRHAVYPRQHLPHGLFGGAVLFPIIVQPCPHILNADTYLLPIFEVGQQSSGMFGAPQVRLNAVGLPRGCVEIVVEGLVVVVPRRDDTPLLGVRQFLHRLNRQFAVANGKDAAIQLGIVGGSHGVVVEENEFFCACLLIGHLGQCLQLPHQHLHLVEGADVHVLDGPLIEAERGVVVAPKAHEGVVCSDETVLRRSRFTLLESIYPVVALRQRPLKSKAVSRLCSKSKITLCEHQSTQGNSYHQAASHPRQAFSIASAIELAISAISSAGSCSFGLVKSMSRSLFIGTKCTCT